MVVRKSAATAVVGRLVIDASKVNLCSVSETSPTLIAAIVVECSENDEEAIKNSVSDWCSDVSLKVHTRITYQLWMRYHLRQLHHQWRQ